MCGITITNCSKNINLSTRVEPEKIKSLLKLILKKKRNKDINKLFELVQNYKSDLNFLNYFKFTNERKQIKLSVEILKKFINKNKIHLHKKVGSVNLERNYLVQKEKILDTLWFLDQELASRFKFVKRFVEKEKYLNHTLIFFKTLNTVINSINLLEIRGRDSLGLLLSINLEKNSQNLLCVKKNLKSKKYIKVNRKNIIVNVIYKNCNIFGSLGWLSC